TQAAGAEVWRLLTFHSQLQLNFDAGIFSRGAVATSAIMLAFIVLYYRTEPNRSLRFIVVFLGTLAAITAAGFVAYYTELYSLLRFFPFRVFPVLVPLFFLLLVARGFQRGQLEPTRPLLVGAAALGLLGIYDFHARDAGLFRPLVRRLEEWHQWERGDRLGEVLDWVGRETPQDATVIAPPWRKDSFYRTGRAQIASIHATPTDRLPEWVERLEALSGPMTSFGRWGRSSAVQTGFAGRSLDELAAVRTRFGGDYLIAEAVYPLPVLYQCDPWKVYDLRALAPSAGIQQRTQRTYPRLPVPAGRAVPGCERSRGERVRDRRGNRATFGPHQPVGAVREGLPPLGRITHAEAGHAEHGGFLLQPAGVGQHERGGLHQRQHVDVPKRLEHHERIEQPL
ncbi:MAG TPA: hypothetical protein VHJ69_02125, partial [Gemmatimonadales bacterium]|nr:hypothetical protein [Gemmatimonadales bacterium]